MRRPRGRVGWGHRKLRGDSAGVQRFRLSPGRTVEDARDTIWVLNAPELYVTLTRKRRWSTKRYVAWSRNAQLQLVSAPEP